MGTTGAAGKTGVLLILVCVILGWMGHMIYVAWQSNARRQRRAAVPYRAGGNRLTLHHQRKGA